MQRINRKPKGELTWNDVITYLGLAAIVWTLLLLGENAESDFSVIFAGCLGVLFGGYIAVSLFRKKF